MKVTLGGDRLGSGNKNKIALRNYERSTHNLSYDWTSSMAAGILYPFMCIPAMRGDSFEIDLNAACRTIPTKGPLFGSFKMQLDIFQCPVRLYQAILHNNPTAIGLKMKNVKFPVLETVTKYTSGGREFDGKFSTSCLAKYLGMSGIGHMKTSSVGTYDEFGRSINAIPFLAYYDIFKNYYSNKQEEDAYVISVTEAEGSETEVTGLQTILGSTFNGYEGNVEWEGNHILKIVGTNLNAIDIDTYLKNWTVNIIWRFGEEDEHQEEKTMAQWNQYYHELGYTSIFKITKANNGDLLLTLNYDIFIQPQLGGNPYGIDVEAFSYTSADSVETLQLKPFKLKNIDDMRMKLLSYSVIGNKFRLCAGDVEADQTWTNVSGTDQTGLPYSTLFSRTSEGVTHNHYALNGLMVKTYQSDLFNNWLNTEWIDGENGIAEITKISTADGSFKIDALNLAEKLYNMLNRVAVSGGTYEDWQDAVYTQVPRRHIESPVYLGGMSNEVVFEEIVQQAPAGEGDNATELGTLGGRGILVKRKGGNVDVKVDEASFIIGIVSLTPRIVQTQGNEWYLTDLETMDDLHKPALDGIGFQNLLGEQLAWWDAAVSGGPYPSGTVTRTKIGKVPAWINYMTNYDRAYGDFAEPEGKGFMVLARNYEESRNGVGRIEGIKDATTYIDPTKYNYAFAYTNLDAQNFWVQIRSNIRARRLMSAKQIPNI